MKVYRVETYGGRGFYGALWDINQPCGESDLYAAFCDTNKFHPSPNERDLEPELYKFMNNYGGTVANYKKTRVYVFGFHTKQLMQNWFKGAGKEAIGLVGNSNHFRIGIYDVPAPDVKKFNFQCLFLKERATMIDSIPFEVMFK